MFKSNRMGKHYIIVCAILCGYFFNSWVYAGATGKIVGIVLDANTSESLAGVNVILSKVWSGNEQFDLPSPKGAATDIDGYYVILNVNPGIYSIQFIMVGYKTKTFEKVSVSINKTTTLDVKLEEAILEGEEIVVTAPRELIQKDLTSSVRTVSYEQIEKFNLESVGEVVALQPGVVGGHFRGGRSEEVVYLVDGVQSGISIHADAVQEVEVISGTFNAEYGKVMSGVVNVAPKEGGSNLTGHVKLLASNWYTDHEYVGLDKSDIFHATEIRYNLSGPVPYTNNKLTFFIHGTESHNKGLYYGIRRYNMWDYSRVSLSIPKEEWVDVHTGDGAYVPMSQGMGRGIMANFLWRAPLNMSVGLLYQYQYSEGQGYNHAYKYVPDRTNWSWSTSHSATLSLSHTISENAFHEFKALYTDNSSQSSRFKNPYDPRYVHDKYSTYMGGFATGGNDKGVSYNDHNRIQLKYDVIWQISNHHEIKTGVDFAKLRFQPYSFTLQNRWKNTEYEATRYEPVIWADTTVYTNRYDKSPTEFSAYIQDKSEFDELVINYGLRYDWFDPNTIYPTDLRNPANRIVGSRRTEYKQAKPQYQVSPRIGLSYQLGDVAALHFSYGHFFQIPSYVRIYQNPDYEISSTNYASTIGNPNIKAEKTVKYELGLQYKFLEDVIMNMTVFYHDIYNLEAARTIETYDAVIYGYYINKDYASTKGVTFSIDYLTKTVNLNFNYTLQFAEGNASEPMSNFYKAAANIDPITKFVPLDWDQRHTLNIAASFTTPNYGVSMINRIGSGTRYTLDPFYKSRLALVNIPENGMTKPMTIYSDLKAYISLGFLTFKSITPQLGFYIYNLFDRRNELQVYEDSGRAGSTLSIEDARDKYVSTFTTIEDQYYKPNYYSSPRLWKVELDLNF